MQVFHYNSHADALIEVLHYNAHIGAPLYYSYWCVSL